MDDTNINLSRDDIDDLVTLQADVDAAWDKSISVNRKRLFSPSVEPSYKITSEKEILSGEPEEFTVAIESRDGG